MSRPARTTRAATVGAIVVAAALGITGCAAPTPSPGPASASTSTGPSSAAPAATPAATEQVAPGDIPDTQAYVTTKAPSGAWSIKVPEGWSERSLQNGFLFTDKLNTIQAVERPASQAPTVASVRSTEIPVLAAAQHGLKVGSVTTFTRQGGSGVVVTYQADSPKDAVTGKVHRDAAEEYLFHKGGRDVVVTVSGAVGADNVDPWRTVTDSFLWLK